jgi:CubicO group peptidase (beta-lactamase class C family)
MKRTSWLAIVAFSLTGCLLFSTPGVTGQGLPLQVKVSREYAGKLRVYEEFVRQEMEREHIPGLTVGFVKGDTMWVKGFGYADLENGVPTRADSSYRLASITKSMTAVAILQLAEKGKVALDAEVQAYVPAFPRKKWPITIRQLLCHMSGLRHNTESEKVVTRHMTTQEAVAQYADAELVAEPGVKFSYSSPGYVLLGAVIESASGQPYEDYMRAHIWGPLGMKDTRMDDPAAIIPHRVHGYRSIDGKIGNSQSVDVSNRFAAGGVRTTVVDMLKFASGLAAGRLLSGPSADLLATSGVTRDGHFTDVGMGWYLNSVNGRFTFTNNGGQQETRTVLYTFPRSDFSIALAMNFEFNDYEPFVRRLYQVLTDERWSFYWEKTVSAKDAVSEALIGAMQSVFSYGLSYFDRYRRPFTQDPEEIRKALAYFKDGTEEDALRSRRQKSLDKIEDGLSPLTGQPLVKLGSFMAGRLYQRSTPERFESYHACGAITFFADYVRMCRADPGDPSALRFSTSLEDQVLKWDQDWTRTNGAGVRRLWISPASNVEEIAGTLRKAFADAEVYPYLNGNMGEATWQLIRKGRREQAALLGQLAVDLYPRSDLAQALLGIVKIMFRKKEAARTLLAKAAELGGSGAVFARAMTSYAQGLSGAGRTDDGLELLSLTAELFPSDAHLYDTMGGFFMKIDDRVRAIESYKKALAIDPKLENSKQMLENLLRR